MVARNRGTKSSVALQPLDMRDHLVRLNAEAKMRRRILHPVLDGRFFDQLPESEIHFDGIQLASRSGSRNFFCASLAG